MREAILYEKLTNSAVRCNICRWRCKINPGKLGTCQTRQNIDGILHTLYYGEISSVGTDPIEKKPLFHFHPSSPVFSLGGWGCNFHCKHCQNWQISCQVPGKTDRSSQYISPEASIELTKKNGCKGISWTYNEPAIWLEYTLDAAKLAKAEGLYTVYVTNGYSTPEALDTIGPYLDAWRVDVKGFTDDFYKQLANISQWRGILEVAERAQKKWNMHVEVITNIISTMNDDDAQLEGIANWIRDSLGESTPWHVTRSYPQYEMQNIPPTSVTTLERAYDIGKKAGLHFIYIGNFPGHEGENTVCYSCDKTVVKRTGYHTEIVGLDGSKCLFCGTELNFRV